MPIGEDLLSSVTGNTAKACLVVHDVSALAKELELELTRAQSAFNGMMGASGLGGGAIGPLTQAASAQRRTVQTLENTRNALAGNNMNLVSSLSAGMNTDKTFFVQFNPNTLMLYSTNHPERKRDLTGHARDMDTLDDVTRRPKVELTTTLTFDKMNIYDSFMFDKFNSGASATTVTGLVTMASGKTFTVQPYVEGLISALRNPYTKAITFQWADFSFTGVLTSLQAEYTMFSVSGRPVRAQVQLRLRQDATQGEAQQWHSEFEQMVSRSTALQTAEQTVGNLLNLSL